MMNAANEVAVGAFIQKQIKFDQIAVIVERVMQNHVVSDQPGLDQILNADRWARDYAGQCVLRRK